MTLMTLESLALAVAMAVAAGLMGCFAVMRRMSLAADPLSHVALPGIGLALAFHIHPLVGAVAMLFLGALLVWLLEERSRAATETMIGVVFSAALAVGALMTSGEDLVDALVGHPGALGRWELLFGLLGSAVVVVFVIRSRHALVIALVSPEVARTTGINVRRLNLLYLELFALTIALGLRYLGVLLMGALIIVPAVTAKRLVNGLNAMMATSVALAITATVVGTWVATILHRESGPMIVLASAAGFGLSLLRRRT